MQNLSSFCNEWLNAWTDNRPDLLIGYYTEDAFYSDPANRTGLRGRAQLLPYFKKLLQHNPKWEWKALEIIETHKGFTLKWEAKIPVGNTIITEQGLDIVELKENKICRNEVYFDPSAWAKAITQISR